MNCFIKSDDIYFSREGYYTKGLPIELYFAFYKPKTKELSSVKQKLELSSGIMSYENEFMNCEL